MSWQVQKFSKPPQKPVFSPKPFKFSSNHSESHEKYKTELCRNLESGFCEYGDKCFYAHSLEELRDKSSTVLKQVKCKSFFEFGYCLLGHRCQFSHKDTPDTAESSPNTSKKTSRKASGEGRVPRFIDMEARLDLI
jgi:hypothetical protein